MYRKILFLGVLFSILASFAKADDIKFTAVAKSPVQVGERFRLTFKVNAQGQNFIPPSIEDFRVMVGPSTSSSSSVQIINGQMTRSVEISYTYFLQAIKEGDFAIPGAKITIDGTTYESNAVNVKVLEGDPTAVQQVNQNTSKSNANIENTQKSINDQSVSNEDVFLRAFASKANPKQGEQIIVTFKLFYRIGISLKDVDQHPGYKGFWNYDLMRDRQNYPQYEQVVNNQRYNVAEIAKVALYPQNSGNVTIDPMKLTVLAKVRESNKRSRDPFEAFFNDSFFGRYKTVEKAVSSNPLTINVQPLPSGKPAGFNGAVGKYSFKSEITDTEVQANDAINIKVTISGKGNLKLIEPPKFNFPPDFEVYDPKIYDNISVNLSGVSGSRTFEYLVIPRSAGEYNIEPATFTYFDLEKNKYITHATPSYNLKIVKGAGDQNNVTYTANNKEDIKHIGSDIRFIENKPFTLHKKGEYFIGSTLFYLLQAAPFLLFAMFVLIWRNKLKQNKNIALMRNKKATKIARKRLANANKFLKEKNKNSFYDEISKALWGYLSDKLNIQTAELTKDNVQENFTANNIDETLATKMIDILDSSEFARFAPGDSQTQMDTIYNDTLSVILDIEKEMNRKLSKQSLKNK